jgi:hypothetical protein
MESLAGRHNQRAVKIKKAGIKPAFFISPKTHSQLMQPESLVSSDLPFAFCGTIFGRLPL